MSSEEQALELARSQYLSAYERSWRQWRDFIREQQEERAAKKQEGSGFDAFGMPLLGTREPFTATLPADVRAQYTRVLEERRQETLRAAEERARTAGQPAPDRDTVFDHLLAHIEKELVGQIEPHGRAIVWHDGHLIDFNHQRVLRQTSDADYRVAQGGSASNPRQRLFLAIGGVLAIVVLMGFAYTRLAGSTVSLQAEQALASINGTPIPFWDTTDMAVAGQSFALTSVQAGYPLQICAPEVSQPLLVPEASVVLTGTESVRMYELVSLESDRADLLVSDCEQRSSATIAKGLLQEAQTSTQLDPNLLRSISVRGADSDPVRIPQDRMLVSLVLDSQLRERGTLILEDGSRFAPTSSETGDLFSLSYLVPLSPVPQAVGLEFVELGHLPAILAFTLPAPTSHAQLLRDVLQVDAEESEVIAVNGSVGLQINLVVKNASNEAISIRSTDPICRQGTTTLTVQWQELMLEGNQNQRQALTCVGIDPQRPLEVELANWAMTFTFLP
jgi:hypothetical protein